MTKVWEHAMSNELQADYQRHPILFVMTPGKDNQYKNKVLEIFFEEFKVDSFYPYVSSSLILFSQGKTSGLVVESGYSLSYSIPVYEGYSIPFGYKSIPVGGKHILEQLIN